VTLKTNTHTHTHTHIYIYILYKSNQPILIRFVDREINICVCVSFYVAIFDFPFGPVFDQQTKCSALSSY